MLYLQHRYVFLVNIIVLVYLYVLLNQLVMIRVYELLKRGGFSPRLVVKIQRFPYDVEAVIKYYFDSGTYEFKFPPSYVAPMVADEVRRFVELINSPHWLSEIGPNCLSVNDPRDNDLPFEL